MRKVLGTLAAFALITGLAVTLGVSSASASHGPGGPGADGRPSHGHHQPGSKYVTPRNWGQRTTTIDYGPFTVPAATMPMEPGDDGLDMAGMGMISNRIELDVAKPCGDCYLTSITPNLVYPDGATANVDTGAWLHHTVFFDSGPGKSDATCATSFLGRLGERFFASGNERTEMVLPSGYGYPVGTSDRWNAIVDLMNMNRSPITVSISLRFTWVPASHIWHRHLHTVRPVWLDVNECGSSEFSVPAGFSSTPWTWTATVAGPVMAIAGHVHDYGVDIYARNDTTGRPICDSVASYGTTPDYIDMMGMAHVSQMSGCLARSAHHPVAQVHPGDQISIHAQYDPPRRDDHVMGIMIAYLASS